MDVFLIPCSRMKRRGGELRPPAWSPLQDLLMPSTWARLTALRLELAWTLELEPGSDLDPLGEAPDVRVMPGYRRYHGGIYQGAALEERWPLPGACRVLVVSALYGLVDLGDDVREHEIKMRDRLPDHKPVWRWWWEAGLSLILDEAVQALEPNEVHNLLTPHYRKAVEAIGGRAPAFSMLDHPELDPDDNAARGRALGELLDDRGGRRRREPERRVFAAMPRAPGPMMLMDDIQLKPALLRREAAESAAPAREDFEQALAERLAGAGARGEPYVNLEAGDLHRAVGGYPGSNHRMPVCCSVMRAAMRSGDSILSEPPGGSGASLRIRYLLPRPAEEEVDPGLRSFVQRQGPIPRGARATHNRLQAITRESVLKAIAECDRKGRQRFGEEYGYGRSYKFPLEYEGREYDSKAILGVAYGYEFPQRGPLRAHELYGGQSMTVPILESLGFRIRRAGR